MSPEIKERLHYACLGALLPLTAAIFLAFRLDGAQIERRQAMESAFRATAVLDLVTNAPILRLDSVEINLSKDGKLMLNGMHFAGGELVLGKRFVIPNDDSVHVLSYLNNRVDFKGVVMEYWSGRYFIQYTADGILRHDWFYQEEIAPMYGAMKSKTEQIGLGSGYKGMY